MKEKIQKLKDQIEQRFKVLTITQQERELGNNKQNDT
jgi:hypothetical protein